MQDAYELFGDTSAGGPLLVICEHASRRVPEPLRTTESDRDWLATHWGWDPGAQVLAREVIRRTHSVGVFSRFSRLICDPNRDPSEPTWIRATVEGYPLSFNAGLDDAERERRLERYHEPYHAAVDALATERQALGGDVVLLSLHSFTPVLGDDVRTMEIGVLYDAYGAIARRLHGYLRDEGFVVAMNKPYSGRKDLMYAARRHGEEHGLVYLELEVRQDLLSRPSEARSVGKRIAGALSRLRVRAGQR